jgi:drug/metabolite transporter (DMT)-like permease
VAIAVGIAAFSSSGPMMAYAAAPALAIAFYRNALAVGGLVPTAAARRRDELGGLARAGWRGPLGYCLLAGLALAGHFATWVPSTKLTSVAAATALVATQPVWQGLIVVALGRRLPLLQWAGIGLAVCGAVAATGADFAISSRAVAGDLLALAGGALAAAYTTLGERVRETTSTTAYTTICYSVCAAVLLVVCLAGGVPLSGYPAGTWAILVAVTVGPQLLGHSLFNYALRSVAATTLAVLVLLEVPGAALISWVWLGQHPAPLTWVGVVLLVGGVLVVLLAARAQPTKGGTPIVPVAIDTTDPVTLTFVTSPPEVSTKHSSVDGRSSSAP